MAKLPTVNVTSTVAKSQPTFLIEGTDGRLWLTVAVVEYFGGDVRTEDQKEGVQFMTSLMRRAKSSGTTNFNCYEIDPSEWPVASYQAPGVGTDPPGGGGVGTQQQSGTSSNGDSDPNS